VPVQQVNIERAVDIPGWMSRTELEWLANQAQSHRRIVEIGSYQGRSTRALADHTPGMILAIDCWNDPTDPDLYRKFCHNLKEHIDSYKVQPWNMNHREILPETVKPRPDFVFIDGNHSYENVYSDIEIWKPVIEPGGMLAGHDFQSEWLGVIQAVNELLPSAEVAEGTTIWWIKL
jgi:predicted O-methyltransferase YrrM